MHKRGIGKCVCIDPYLTDIHIDFKYQLHEQGKTEQAQKDLARLAIIRKEREEAAAKKKAQDEGTYTNPQGQGNSQLMGFFNVHSEESRNRG